VLYFIIDNGFLLCLFLDMLCCAVNKVGNAAIHDAAHFGELDIVKYLICEAGVDVNVRGAVR